MTTSMLPRLVVAAPASGHGKTTIVTGLLAALRARGLTVSPHKVGPDYVDPGYHALAAGRPGRNLDAFLVGEERIVPLLRHGAATPVPADIAVIEGVMGLFDGAVAGQVPGFASTAHIARLTNSPVVLVVDVTGMGRSVAALLHGYTTFDPSIRVAGVILNKVGSARHAALLREAIAPLRIAVLGAIPRRATLSVPARHLGLVPATDAAAAARALIDELAAVVTREVDLDAVIALARSAPPLPALPHPGAGDGAPGSGGPGGEELLGDEPPHDELRPAAPRHHTLGSGEPPAVAHRGRAASDAPGHGAVRIAIAAGPAFVAGYAEHAELLTAAGAEVVTFDPMVEPHLPPGTAGVVLGCGSIEVHAQALAANTSLRAEIAALAAAGAPVIAECAGLAYLSRTFAVGDEGSGGTGTGGDRGGASHGRADRGGAAPMCGVLDVDTLLGDARRLGYRQATALTDSVLGPAGMLVHGHEFHSTAVRRPSPPATAWGWSEAGDAVTDGWVGGPSGNVHASFLHLHWAGVPEIPARIVAAARRLDRGACHRGGPRRDAP